MEEVYLLNPVIANNGNVYHEMKSKEAVRIER